MSRHLQGPGYWVHLRGRNVEHLLPRVGLRGDGVTNEQTVIWVLQPKARLVDPVPSKPGTGCAGFEGFVWVLLSGWVGVLPL